MAFKMERLKASSPFLILCLLILWFGGRLIQTTQTMQSSLEHMRRNSHELTEAVHLHQSWQNLLSDLSAPPSPIDNRKESFDDALSRTLSLCTQLHKEHGNRQGENTALISLENRLHALQESPEPLTRIETTDTRQSLALVIAHLSDLTEEIRQDGAGIAETLSASPLPSHALVFFMTLATILLVLLLENLFAGRIRNHLITLRDTLLQLNQNRFNLETHLEMKLHGWEGIFYPLPKIAYLINCFLERHNEMLRKIGTSAENCENATRLIRNCHKEIYEGTRVQASSSDDTSSSIFEMSATLKEISSNIQSLSNSTEESSKSVRQMDGSIHRISEESDELFRLIQNSSASIDNMIASIGESRNSLNSLSSSVETSTVSVAEINTSTKEVARLAKESAALSQKSTIDTSEQGVKAVQKTIEGMLRIRNSVEGTDRMVRELNTRSEKIGEILNVIDEVAEKTNLLALNAAIIASKSGEHGKGFSVVADEIKSLAVRTSLSIDQIETVISNVQEETRDITQAIHQSVEEVKKGMDLSKETKVALESILKQSQRSSEMSWKIEGAAIEQVRSIEHIDTEIQNINNQVKQITAAVEEQDKGGEVIRGMVAKLTSFAEELKQSMSEESNGSRRISQEIENIILKIEEINRSIQEHRKGSESIERSIQRIKVITEENSNLTDDLNTAISSLALYNDELQKEVSQTTVGSQQETFTLGIVPLESEIKMETRFTPLARYLEKKLKKPVKIQVARDFQTAVSDIGTGKCDIAYLTPSTYVEAKKKYGTQIILKAVRNHMPFYRSVIAVRKGNSIRSIADLKGKKFAFGDQRSTSSSLVPRAMLAKENIDLHDLAAYDFLGRHDDVAWAIVNGDVDAGGLLEPIAKKFETKGLQVLETSADIPEFNVCVRADLPPEIKEEITRAFLELDEKVSDDRNIIQTIEYEYNGFTAATEEDYAGIAEMMQLLGNEVA